MIIEELERCFDSYEYEGCRELLTIIRDGAHIFVTGIGRTGYIMRCFAMRLMQAGYATYWIGDNNTPHADERDILIIGSGSGETEVLKCYMQTARRLKMKTALLTTSKDSTLAKQADVTIQLKACGKFEHKKNAVSVQPMGSLFEQELLIYLDALVLSMMECDMASEDEMKNRHANIE